MQELGFTVVSWQAKVEMLIKAITDDLLNQSQSVHLRNIVTVSEEGEEREEVEGGRGRRRKRLPAPVFWPGEFHGLYSPQGCKELDTTE